MLGGRGPRRVPFCGRCFERGEAKECPVCGMALVAFENCRCRRRPTTSSAFPKIRMHEAAPSWTYLGRMRGALPIVALLGPRFFFSPWIHQTLPDDYEPLRLLLARRLGWVWGAGIGWLVLVPTVLSRRTIAQMRGARVAAMFLSATSLVSCASFLFPPHGRHYKPHFVYEPAFFATAIVSRRGDVSCRTSSAARSTTSR